MVPREPALIALSVLCACFTYLINFISVCISGCDESSQLHRPLLELRRAEAALGRSAWASCCFSSSSCREQALGEGAAVAEIDPRALEHRPLAVARGLRRSMACGLFAEQGSN